MSTNLDVFGDNAAYSMREATPLLLGGRVSWGATLDFCDSARTRGIAALLLDADAAALHRELCRSGRAMLHALPRIDPREQVTSKLRPFFDALAAGDTSCAQGLASGARGAWNAEEEYEDDFLYVHFLMQRLSLGADARACDAIVARWEAVLDGAADPRLGVAKSIARGDGAAFAEALEGLLAHERARYAKLRRRAALADETDATEARVSIEGIALTRVGRALGFTLPDDSWGVPSVALVERPPAFTGDGWQSI
jgi:hypothetical protein